MSLRALISCLLLSVVSVYLGSAQLPCQIAVDQYDEFDSTRMVVTQPIPVGYLIPSNFETADGYKMIDEGQLMVTFSSNDTLDAFFLVLGLQEHTYRSITSGSNLLLLLDNQEVIGLVNFPDNGTFSRENNMRLYMHTAAIPLDAFYKLIYNKVQKIRVMYKGHYHTMTLLPKQQAQIQQQFLCLGKRLDLFPVKP